MVEDEESDLKLKGCLAIHPGKRKADKLIADNVMAPVVTLTPVSSPTEEQASSATSSLIPVEL